MDTCVLVDNSECDRLIFNEVVLLPFLVVRSLVFFSMTWYNGGMGQLVVALRVDSRAFVGPAVSVNNETSKQTDGSLTRLRSHRTQTCNVQVQEGACRAGFRLFFYERRAQT